VDGCQGKPAAFVIRTRLIFPSLGKSESGFVWCVQVPMLARQRFARLPALWTASSSVPPVLNDRRPGGALPGSLRGLGVGGCRGGLPCLGWPRLDPGAGRPASLLVGPSGCGKRHAWPVRFAAAAPAAKLLQRACCSPVGSPHAEAPALRRARARRWGLVFQGPDDPAQSPACVVGEHLTDTLRPPPRWRASGFAARPRPALERVGIAGRSAFNSYPHESAWHAPALSIALAMALEPPLVIAR